MGKDKIELIAFSSQESMVFLPKVWMEVQRDEKIKPSILSSNYFFFSIEFKLRGLIG